MKSTQVSALARACAASPISAVWAVSYADAGLHPIRLAPPRLGEKGTGKRPVEDEWQTRPLKLDALCTALAKAPKSNLGLRMGKQPDGTAIVALDVDDADAAMGLFERLGAPPRTMQTETGRGGHLFYRVPSNVLPSLRNFTARDGIDLRAEGGQVVAAPSIHFTGTRYKTKIRSIADLPQAWIDWLLESAPAKARSATASADDLAPIHNRDLDLSPLLKHLAPAGVDDGRHELSRAIGGWAGKKGFRPEKAAEAVRLLPSDRPDDRAEQARDAAERARQGLEAPGWEYLSRRFPKKALRRLEKSNADPVVAALIARRARTAPAREASVLVRTKRAELSKAERRAGNEAALAEAAPGLTGLDTDDEGQPLGTINNVSLCVRHLLGRALARNAATGREVLTESVTLTSNNGGDEIYPKGLWNDILTSRVAAQINRMGMRSVRIEHVDRMVASVAAERMHWPVKSYLESLPEWDRVERSLCSYLGVERTRYAEAVASMWLRSCVARGMKPGCQVDHVLVLEGDQGIAKSSALSVLAGDEWYGEFTAKPGDAKQVGEQLQGKWIVEISELDKFTRGFSESDIKALITRRVDDYRAAYGRHSELRPRTTVFAGSTNRDEYLTDDTGNRRYWPIVVGAVGSIDLGAIRADREQLWAQALAEYRESREWWPSNPKIKALIEIEQAKRLATDAWFDVIAAWATGQEKPFALIDMLRDAVHLDPAHVGDKQKQRAAICLKSLGFTKKHSKHGNVWHRAG